MIVNKDDISCTISVVAPNLISDARVTAMKNEA